MHGAMLIDKDSGERIDDKGIKGVRVTGIASADIAKYRKSLKNDGSEGLHLEEALILASKIASCKGIVAELCWSDDPSYVIGYVGTNDKYERIPILKDEGNPVGGRVFFVDANQLNDDYTLDDLIDYLEKQVVLIVERALAEKYNIPIVNAVPQPKAGGSPWPSPSSSIRC